MDIPRLLAEDDGLARLAAALRSDPHGHFPLLTAKIKLTWRCNLRCQMCLVWQRAQQVPDRCELPTPLVLETLAGLAPRGVRKVHFSGGELLLHEGFRDVIGCARSLGLQVNFTTNGTRLDKDTARYLVDQRVHCVAFSIDDASPRRHDAVRGVSGAWKAAWKGLLRLREATQRKGHGPAVTVNTVVTRQNIDHMADLYRLLFERGVDRWRLLPVDTSDRTMMPSEKQWTRLAGQWDAWTPLLDRLPLGWQAERPERSAHRAHKGCYAVDFYGERICFAPWFNLFIDANGAVYPCCAGKVQIPTYGNLFEQPLGDILDSPRRREVRASMAAGHLFPICDTCDDFLEENAAFSQPREPS